MPYKYFESITQSKNYMGIIELQTMNTFKRYIKRLLYFMPNGQLFSWGVHHISPVLEAFLVFDLRSYFNFSLKEQWVSNKNSLIF